MRVHVESTVDRVAIERLLRETCVSKPLRMALFASLPTAAPRRTPRWPAMVDPSEGDPLRVWVGNVYFATSKDQIAVELATMDIRPLENAIFRLGKCPEIGYL